MHPKRPEIVGRLNVTTKLLTLLTLLTQVLVKILCPIRQTKTQQSLQTKLMVKQIQLNKIRLGYRIQRVVNK